VLFEAESVKITGDLTVDKKTTLTGDVATKAGITNKGVNIGNTHTHGGVQSGTGNTGVVTG
jgi:phage baseplate assembly protein gpV